MALFFDQDWFAARLREKNSDKTKLAERIGVDAQIMEMIWKDQRALTLMEVSKIAAFFDLPAATITEKAGIATPAAITASDQGDLDKRLAAIATRLERIERILSDLKNLVIAQNLPK